MPQRATEADAVRDLVKARDLDRYWSTLFAPPDKRSALLSIYAFHLEIQRIPAVVSQPMLGQIRLQWWRDAIDGAPLSPKTGNPLADALTQTIVAHDLDKADFFRAIDARSAQLFEDQFASFAAFKAFLDDAEGTTFRLAAAVLGDRCQHVLAASKDAAELAGLVSMIRVPSSYGGIQDTLPEFAGGGTTLVGADRSNAPAEIGAPGITPIIGFAREAHARFRTTSLNLTPSVRPAFLHLALAAAYLNSALNAKSAHLSPIRRFLILWRASQRRSFMP